MVLELDIKKKLGNFKLDISFTMENEVFALLGASGCGKSMTLKCIAGIEQPDEGRIVLNGRVLYDSAKNINLTPQKRKVGYMFQDYALFPNMTVEKNIMAGMGKHPQAGKVEEYIRIFRLQGLERRLPGELSGGQKQRVAMARMLAAEPEILLLDEPFSALDSYLQWEVEREMMEILEKIKKPVVFVSHNRDEVYRICDLIGVVEAGKLEVIETKEELFENPKTVAAALLSGCKNIFPIRKIDEYHFEFEALDHAVFYTGQPIPERAGYVGIRAHYIDIFPAGNGPAETETAETMTLETEAAEPMAPKTNESETVTPETGESKGVNCVRMVIDRIIQQPFSTVIMLRMPAAEKNRSLIRIEMGKEKAAVFCENDAVEVHFYPKTLLLLRK